jgi:hypothetical protein
VYGSALVFLDRDSFRSRADAAVAASDSAVATVQAVSAEELSGAGVVAYDGIQWFSIASTGTLTIHIISLVFLINDVEDYPFHNSSRVKVR